MRAAWLSTSAAVCSRLRLDDSRFVTGGSFGALDTSSSSSRFSASSAAIRLACRSLLPARELWQQPVGTPSSSLLVTAPYAT